MSNKSFVHLHVHADGSALDGLSQVKKMVPRALELGQTSLAITDHGSMSATYDLYKATKGTDLKPIYGIEAYLAPAVPRTHKEPVRWADGGGDDVSGAGAYTHMTMWAETNEGLHNLFRLSSEAYLTGFYRKPRMDEELLRKYHKGIIATTGCPSGEVQTWLRIGNYEKAKEAAAKFAEIFGEGNFFVELMDHGLEIERIVIPQLLQIAKELGLPTVATNDSHYTHQDDSHVHEALLCIGSGSKLDDPSRFKFDGNGYYLKTAEEMRAIWDHVAPDACDNTVLIAERCVATFEDGHNLMPEFPVPEGETESSLLEKEVMRGLETRYPEGVPEDRTAQAKYEVDIINQMGFPGYFLVTSDFIVWAKKNGIRVGPGRGSAAGSIVAYAMGITDIDPMKHGLMFERFLNPERVSMPDIDVDFDDRRRGEVIQYVIDKYGEDKVANITTFMSVKAKAAIKDAARVLNMPYMFGDALTKVYPQPIVGRDLSLTDAYDPSNERYDEAAEFRALAESNNEYKEIVKLARGLEGVRRGHGMHAAGVIMSKKPLVETVPLMRRDTNSPMMTQFEYPTCEYLGLLKMDFLGLSNLGTLDEALRLIKQNRGVEVDLDKIGEDLNDKTTFELLARGETLGVFQLDSPPMRSLLKLMEPDQFEDISAVLALYRPGPMGAGSHIEYAERKNNRRPNVPIHPELEEALEPILGETYGLCLTGDTMIWDALHGEQVRLDSIWHKVENSEFYTLGINSKGEVVPRKVSHWQDHGIQGVYEVVLSNSVSLRMTAEHKMLTQDGFKQAQELRVGVDSFAVPKAAAAPGDKAGTQGQEWVEIVSIEYSGEEQVYDIEVEDIHNFIANGVISSNCIYQEQVMKIAQDLAGYSLGKADLLRRAMGKKDPKILAQEFAPFREGMRANKYSDEAIQALWDVLVPFSDYAFNRAHTAGYGLVSYWTAYLKANFPAEYMAALLTTNADNKDKLALYLGECRRMGIKVLSPDVNESELNYTAVGEDIRVGLIGVKNVGEKVVNAWLEIRKENGPAKSFGEFLMRADGNLATKRTLESLVKAGGLDSFGHTRAAMFSIIEDALKISKRAIKASAKKDSLLFEDDSLDIQIDVPDISEWEKNEKLKLEREMLGLYVSDHPLGEYAHAISLLSSISIADLRDAEYPPSDTVRLAGLISAVERKTTKKAGEPWALVTIEDLDSSINVFVFPKTYSQFSDLLVRDSVLLFSGKAEKRDDGSTSIIIQDISKPDLTLAQVKAERRMDRVERGDMTMQEAKSQPLIRKVIDPDVLTPIIVNVDEDQINDTTVNRLKDSLLEYSGTRPVHIRMRVKTGEFKIFGLPPIYNVTGSAELAAEIRALFGPESV